MKTIKQLKVGDFFRLHPNGKVYVRGEYRTFFEALFVL